MGKNIIKAGKEIVKISETWAKKAEFRESIRDIKEAEMAEINRKRQREANERWARRTKGMRGEG